MDQFRGYTVAGMFVVNFLGGLRGPPRPEAPQHLFQLCRHDHAELHVRCGFSYRLTTLRAAAAGRARAAYAHVVVRSLGLVLVSLMMYGFEHEVLELGRDDRRGSLRSSSPGCSRRTCRKSWRSSGWRRSCSCQSSPPGPGSGPRRWRRSCWPTWPLVLVQLRFRLRPAELDGRLLGDDRDAAWDGGLLRPDGLGDPDAGRTLAYDVVTAHARTARRGGCCSGGRA